MFNFFNNKDKNILNFIENLNNNQSSESYKIYLKHPEVNSFPLSLHFACYFKNKKIVRELINAGRPINLSDSAGYNALHYLLSMKPHFKDFNSLRKKKEMYVESLLRNSYSQDNLYFDVSDEDIIEIIEMLIDKGIDINKKSNNIINLYFSDNYTLRPLDFAVQNGSLSIIKFLVKAGIETSYWDCHSWQQSEGFTSVLHNMYGPKDSDEEFEIFKFLHQNGALLELTMKDSLLSDEFFLLPQSSIQPEAHYFRWQLSSHFEKSKKIHKYILENSSG